MRTETTSHTENLRELGIKLAGKYLIFALDKEEYAIEILKVNQIIRLQLITAIPCTPSFVRGVINLRGMIIPIIDLRKKFGMSDHPDTERTCIVVIQLCNNDTKINIGVVIDEVREVLEIAAADIEPTPEFGIIINTEFITGIAKTGKSVKMILDISKVLTTSEIGALTALSEKADSSCKPGTAGTEAENGISEDHGG
ncbi:MAG TPA: chemotaxis protein CheW [Chitinispirillaceae bacterium]|nr:chemotaxis protein CheW [Chitinispirillaceae bacterium]